MSDLLNHISPFFAVSQTKYGGRGCYSYNDILAGTEVARVPIPLSSTILKEFKKEVCCWCFRYQGGRTMKHRLEKGPLTLYFCSEYCVGRFHQYDVNNVCFDSLMIVEEHFRRQKGEPEPSEPDGDIDDAIATEWAAVALWEEQIAKMKPSKRQTLIPHLTGAEYLDVKYIVGVLFQQYKHASASLPSDYLCDIDGDAAEAFELAVFATLDSNEIPKVRRYPYLLHSYITMYKFVRLTCRPELQPYITIENIRNIIGRQLMNAFGIWLEVSDPREDKEFFGYAVYPSASMFNHSCSPNIVKTRVNNSVVFKTLRDIAAGEELCINYGYTLEETVEVRRKDLQEWFFECSCEQCEKEVAEKPAKE